MKRQAKKLLEEEHIVQFLWDIKSNKTSSYYQMGMVGGEKNGGSLDTVVGLSFGLGTVYMGVFSS